MKYQSLFSVKYKKNIINLLSAESAHSMVIVKALSRMVAGGILSSL